ncbi:hypothetical protein [Mycobacteroides chelonae]|uniref:hypothetical protein n=1 Tax=Mycobacteroides chelonae TaxID=1774 RepID=UPI001C2C9D35|nr:hypothetical protein [Mycobacteroides chelonae]MBV0917022.1 hypothetical protein [Mycobacteroides chelonae]
MATSADVRASRDGDRFHYYWAARRALRLLDPNTDLELVAVEGLPEGDVVPGEEVIDVAEYYGGQNAATCTLFRLAQLKHSTVRTHKAIVASELGNTLEKFAKIYRAERGEGREAKLEFLLVANRSLTPAVRTSLQELASGAVEFTHAAEIELLRKYMGFQGDVEHEADFCRRLEINEGVPGLKDLEQILRGDLQQYLPGGGTGTEMVMLIDTVQRCATSLADSQTLSESDILLALRSTKSELLPAPNAIEVLTHTLRTRALDDVLAQLRDGEHNKLLITAVGGIGKSILASTIGQHLPEGSKTIVYDCFAGGDYRKVTAQRHQHRVALTQISNELAAQGLCAPLIPTDAADYAYTRVFMRRIHRAASELAEQRPDAVLAIVIDAADNAAMAAGEFQSRTFVTDLLREDWPPNARLVELCRPERKALLNTPSGDVAEMALSGFEKSESLEHLRTRFPNASAAQAAELHVLSDGNPRVQAMAMENAGDIADVLEALEIARTKPGEVLDSLLAKQIADVADSGHLSSGELSRLCEALATLHPPIPLDDLAEISGVDANAIRGFAVALGRGLYAAAGVLQFRDEPTETWFRNNHGLDLSGRKKFADAVKPLAETSPYVANALPQLLFEAAMLDDLVELALSDAALPGEVDELQAQEIARSRARFALSATLRAKRNEDAALLAVAAGDMSSGHSRKMKMFRENTDLTAHFLDAGTVDNLCSGRELGTDWPGSNLHVEASLLSAIDECQDMARSRLRAAHNNFVSIVRLPDEENGRRLSSNIGFAEVADLALAATNIDGAKGGIRYLSLWRRKDFVRRVSGRVCMRLADAGRYEDISGLVTTRKNRAVQAAASETLYEYNIAPNELVVESLVKGLRARRKPYRQLDPFTSHSQNDIRGVIWILAYGLKFERLTADEALRILDVHLPAHLPDWAGSIGSYTPTSSLLAYALRARLNGRVLTKEDVTSQKLLEEMSRQHSQDRYRREFEANILRLLPWAECWLAAILEGACEAVLEKFKLLIEELRPVGDHNTPFVFINGIAEIATRILTIVDSEELRTRFANWHERADARIARSRLAVARIASRSPRLQEFGLQVVARGVDVMQTDRSDSETRVDALIELARTLYAVNETEARTIFEIAVAEAQQVGDDLHPRWMSLLHAANALSPDIEGPRAYRLFQIAEELDRVVGDADTVGVADRLRRMHEPTYLAAASRCRDRRVLEFESMITPAVKSVDNEHISYLALLAFGPRCGWQKAVEGLTGELAATATAVVRDFTRYEREPSERPDTSYSGSSSYPRSEEDQTVDITIRFAIADFTTEAAWNNALQTVRWSERSSLAEFALGKHPTRRPDVLDAFGCASAPRSTDFVALAQAASSLPSTPGLQRALDRLGTTFATRFASQICTWIYDEHDDLASIASATGLSAPSLLALAFYELGSSAYQLKYADYFQVAGRLASTLEPSSAGKVFDSLSRLFEDLAPSETSADGPYESLPVAPADVAASVSGLIWSALGDMSIAVRWRAAHAVLLLVRLGCEDELEALLRYADQSCSSAPFLDSRLPFYSLHARMWLLLALSRASQELNAGILARFAPFLVSVVVGPPHAVNQVLAQRALNELAFCGVIAPGEITDTILKRRLGPDCIELGYTERRTRPNPLAVVGDDDQDGVDHFFYDFGSYWCSDVAEIFGGTEDDVERKVSQCVRGFDGYDLFHAGVDPRLDANVYREGGTHPDRGSWPVQENHRSYLAIHGLLTVAAELATTELAYKDPDLQRDSYSEWLARFLPKRRDGRWLADCRDHPPVPTRDLTLAAVETQSNWSWSITVRDFAEAAGFDQEWISVWANSEARHGELSEDVAIESAMVSHETARALLVALQTSPGGPYPAGLPTEGDSSDWSGEGLFALKPWIESTTHYYGIDEHDERAGEVPFPGAVPSEEIIARLRLAADRDFRAWSSDTVAVFRRTLWNDMRRAAYDNESGVRGALLQINRESLRAVLSEFGMSLVLAVGLRRQRSFSSHGYSVTSRKGIDDDDEFGWLQWSGKVYVIRPDGQWLEY